MNSVERVVREFISPVEFEEYLRGRGLSEKYVRDLVSHLARPLDPGNKYSVLAYRHALHLLRLRHGVDVSRFLEGLKVPKNGVDLRVPSVEEVAACLRRLEGLPGRTAVFFLLLLYTGLRGSEVRRLLSSYDYGRCSVHGDVVVYPLNWERGAKKCYYAFMPLWLALRLERVEVGKDYYTYRARDYGLLPAKYLRKFFATRMFELGAPAEVIDFIQGRTPRSVLAQHYLQLLPKSVEWYRRYVEWLDGLVSAELGSAPRLRAASRGAGG